MVQPTFRESTANSFVRVSYWPDRIPEGAGWNEELTQWKVARKQWHTAYDQGAVVQCPTHGAALLNKSANANRSAGEEEPCSRET
jgi:hypothetical protein